MKKPTNLITVGAKFTHVDCGYKMEIVDISTKKGSSTVIVKYLDRDKPNWSAPIEYLRQMFGFKRFVFE